MTGNLARTAGSFAQLMIAFWLFVCFPTAIFANDGFRLFIPDAANRRLVELSIRHDDNTIQFQSERFVKLPFVPSGVTLNQARQQLIVTSGSTDVPQGVTISLLDDATMQVGEVVTLKHASGYTSIDRTGRYFLTADYSSGNIASYFIAADGSVGDMVQLFKTPNPAAHCILTNADNKFFYVPCVKQHNAIFQFTFDDSYGGFRPLEPFDAKPPAMFGPRHVVYHPNLPIAYFSNEQQLGVSVYRIAEDGQLSAIQHATTMPRRTPYELGKRDLHASDLVISDDGTRLYVAVRDFTGDEDTVFSFRVERDGRLSVIARSKVGDIPWKLALSPDGQLLVVSETGQRRLTVYQINENGQVNNGVTWKTDIETRDMVLVN